MDNRIKISPDLRELLRRPFGHLIRGDSPSAAEIRPLLRGAQRVISVGDATTENLLTVGITPSIQIIDLKEKRRGRDPILAGLSGKKRIINNPSGFVTFEAVSAIREVIHSDEPILLQVDGEEDLLALPSVALSPIGGAVAYGQPDEGMVVVSVDKETKLRAEKLLKESGLPEYLLKY